MDKYKDNSTQEPDRVDNISVRDIEVLSRAERFFSSVLICICRDIFCEKKLHKKYFMI